MNEVTLSDLIQALSLPETYPHPVEVITTIETHISVVFLTGEFAYKLKKPVDFGFLDFTHLDQRRHYYRMELELNKRTAPQLYLDVLPFYRHSDGSFGFEPEAMRDQPIEYLLKMRQFDPNNVLSRLLQKQGLEDQQVEALALQIADFHANATTVDDQSNLGDPPVILQPMLDNFPTLLAEYRKSAGEELTALQAWTQQTYHCLFQRLQSRKNEGFIRACHGDLHLDNIALVDERPLLFDGIEFNENFRWIDVLSDLAFLLIDLDFRKQRRLKNHLLSIYLNQTQDYAVFDLLKFYRVYRTLVRAKISGLRCAQLDEKDYRKKQMQQTTLDYIHQALDYSREDAQPKLILLQGVSGSGKSYLAAHLLDWFDAIILSSDRTRKRLYGIHATTRIQEADKQALYSEEMSRRTYETLLSNASTLLKQRQNVIVDATFLKREHRQVFYALQNEIDCKPFTLSIQVSQTLAEQSIRYRQQLNQDPSDADAEVMLRQMAINQPPAKEEPALSLPADELRLRLPEREIRQFLKIEENPSI
ncbi:AAA family ATPase [Thiomicrorhabdus sp.]|uniref:bifunctional aminoglycoside phosphotransferase/ATP-binding protein n=1 Tax=Thiomicrorhabdus sp. TaxID=2039724 RepID=UPI0029C736FC|nr:AAA family ATPase [Thiomicrorhabdus sp.]